MPTVSSVSRRGRIVLVSVLAGLVLLLSHTVPAAIIPSRVVTRVAEYVSTMLTCGRGVVAENQSLINDPNKGDKGFSPKFVRKGMISGFERKTGQALEDLDPEVREILYEFLDAASKVVEENQPLINQERVGFKGFIPAVFGRLTGMKFRYATGVSVRQVTFKPRNLYNEPDSFEREMLNRYENGQLEREYGHGLWTDDHTYRYVYPLYIEESCLQCHGEPAGALDITGKVKEGYKLGQLRGAISVLLRTD